jgi:hypothetical protein
LDPCARRHHDHQHSRPANLLGDRDRVRQPGFPGGAQVDDRPLTAQFPPFNDDVYYGLGIGVTNSWMVQTPSFAGYAAAMAYLPAKEIGIAVTATLGPNGPTEGRPTDALVAKIGAYLVPDQAPIMP